MEPQHTQPTSTQPTLSETGVTTTGGVPIESVIESHIASPDVSRSAEEKPNLTHTPDNVLPEPTPAYSSASLEKPVRIEPVPQVAKVTPLHLLREHPVWIDCPFCERRAMTRVGHEGSSATMLASLVCCLICICLVCVPSLTGMYQDTSHYCTNCGKKVAHKPHDGQTQPIGPMLIGEIPSRRPLA
ncbi:LITAF-like zinc finger domain-containing protein [Penicillium frequentans]|uniref:LITAF-like zinc finger domain-containing protein n=1 Tax=Penicillium frequentans TaxID=3151616 RepID=A0AAD6D1Y8_9EURO|nr:LITAF-like zinc finger domain-containing protein [Penicillium glabrum]